MEEQNKNINEIASELKKLLTKDELEELLKVLKSEIDDN